MGKLQNKSPFIGRKRFAVVKTWYTLLLIIYKQKCNKINKRVFSYHRCIIIDLSIYYTSDI